MVATQPSDADRLYQARLQAVLLVNKVELETWYAAGMKRYQGQAKIKRVINYLTETVGK